MSPATSRIFAELLEARTGQQLTAGRRWRIETALKPLLRDHAIESLDRLAGTVANDRRLGDAVVEALLNNETFFFREPAAFDLLTGPALDRLAEARAAERRLRIWCAGCSTGQEAYSLAIRFAEQGARWDGWSIDLIGTDISHAAIAQAREATYSHFEIQRGLSVHRMMRWFDAVDDRWRLIAPLRKAVHFRTHNLLDPPPIGARADIVLCRNVLLYFATPMRTAVLDRIAGAIAGDGMLMLGAGETVLGQTERFVSDPAARGLYRPA